MTALLTPKQRGILDYLHTWFSDGEGAISVAEIAEALGYSPTGMSLTMYSLHTAGHVGLLKGRGRDGGGSAHVVIYVRHPSKGLAQPEPISYDHYADCWRFKKDLPELVRRACLACGEAFDTPSKFVRFCGACKSSDNWSVGADGGDYISNGQAILTNQIGGYRRLRGS